MNYKSCERTESYYRSKLTRKLWKLAADKHHKHRCNVWLIIMGAKMKYQWVNSWKMSPNYFSCKISSFLHKMRRFQNPEWKLMQFTDSVCPTVHCRDALYDKNRSLEAHYNLWIITVNFLSPEHLLWNTYSPGCFLFHESARGQASY